MHPPVKDPVLENGQSEKNDKEHHRNRGSETVAVILPKSREQRIDPVTANHQGATFRVRFEVRHACGVWIVGVGADVAPCRRHDEIVGVPRLVIQLGDRARIRAAEGVLGGGVAEAGATTIGGFCC